MTQTPQPVRRSAPEVLLRSSIVGVIVLGATLGIGGWLAVLLLNQYSLPILGENLEQAGESAVTVFNSFWYSPLNLLVFGAALALSIVWALLQRSGNRWLLLLRIPLLLTATTLLVPALALLPSLGSQSWGYALGLVVQLAATGPLLVCLFFSALLSRQTSWERPPQPQIYDPAAHSA